ncbi:MAG: hypothetical protein FJ404_15195 [Verrucomicrobia bacterium]|nr:hypothetical protein [Verrucomicrobiota bacterium]
MEFLMYRVVLRRLGTAAGLLACLGLTRLEAEDREDSLRAAPLGNKVQLWLNTADANAPYILEGRARLADGPEWETLMQFRSSSAPRGYVDALCGTLESRFFRLRRLLEAPPVEVSNFRLIDTAGAAHELYYQRLSPAVAVVLAGRDVASVQPYLTELLRVQQSSKTPFPTWILSATAAEERGALAGSVRSFPSSIKVMQDASHAVHRTLGSGQAPEVALISTLDWSLFYRGPILDEVDVGGRVIRSTPFSDAVGELLGKRQASLARMATVGVGSGLRPRAVPSYSSEVAPLILKSCMPCHQPGDIAPWSMTNHAVLKEFSKLIKSSVLAGDMPPWHADPAYASLSNKKALDPESVDLLVAWIDAGCPKDGQGDPLAERPPPDEKARDWPLGAPDAIMSIDPQSIPAEGVVDYRYLLGRNPFPTNVWLSAVVVKPGDRSVVHHCLVFKGGFSEVAALRGGLGGFFAGYVPGMEQKPFPEGTGKLLRSSDLIVFQMHYTTSGKSVVDQTQLGLYLAKTKPPAELITTAASTTAISIPPQTLDSPISATRTFTRKSVIYELSPHMHYRGSRARYSLVYPDGTQEVLLNVPRYFFDWQALYRLAVPKEVPAGTRLVCDGGFDNSTLNRFNPDPNALVRFGEQSWEEMFIGYVNYAEVP